MMKKELISITLIFCSSIIIGQNRKEDNLQIDCLSKQVLTSKLSEKDVENFLQSFEDTYSNNIEYSEFRDELLYNMLIGENAEIVIQVLEDNQNLPLNNILKAIENPVNDLIDIRSTYDNVFNISNCTNIKIKILESIKNALEK